MANVLVDDQYLKNIGDAIRAKNNSSLKYKPSEMANMIKGLQIGDPSINVYSNDAWKYNIDQKEHQTINVEVAASFSGNNTGYFSELCFTPSISSNYGYNAGTIRKTIDEINHIANFTADDATELDEYITDGWAGVYVINNNYYRNSGSSTAPKLKQVSTNSSIENLLILGYYTDTTLSTPITTNTVAGYAPSSKSSLKKYQNKYATSIGDSAFSSCSALTSIDLSNATSIGVSAFYSCSALTSIDLSNATSIGDYAFESCSALTSIDVSNATSIGNYAFYSCNKLTSIDLSNATSIGDSAFKNCSALTSIDVSNATSIGDYAFKNCSALTSIDVSNATSIGISAFYSCNKLTSIDVSNATSIGNSAFSSCSALKYIVIDNNTVSKARIKPPTGAKVLIPQSMMKTYSSDSYWSSYASQLDAIENYIITRENSQITVTIKKTLKALNLTVNKTTTKTTAYFSTEDHSQGPTCTLVNYETDTGEEASIFNIGSNGASLTLDTTASLDAIKYLRNYDLKLAIYGGDTDGVFDKYNYVKNQKFTDTAGTFTKDIIEFTSYNEYEKPFAKIKEKFDNGQDLSCKILLS